MATNGTEAAEPTAEAVEPKICRPGGSGLFFPLTESEQHLDDNLRAAIYTLVLIYLFCGVSVVADRFMDAIDRITSRKKIVRMPGSHRTIETWNGTIANLSLLALGSSAPEILLSIVEIFMNKFYAGDLGPGTMIGSAAFNLCVIVAVGISAIPSPDTRQVKHESVFFVTIIFAFFAYIWLTFIVQINSPDVVTIAEGLLTVSFYPVLLVTAYLAHIGWFSGKPAGMEQPMNQQSDLRDPEFIRDAMGKPIMNVNGVLTFEDDVLEVDVGLSERQISVPVLRKNGTQGSVSCKYRMEARNAVPGKDFLMDEGELCFPEGVSIGEIPVTLLPKALTEHSDKFQIIIEDATGGAVFNPFSDGKEEKCILTVEIYNQNDEIVRKNSLLRMARAMDGIVNMDGISAATTSWSASIAEALAMPRNEDGSPPSGSDTLLHFLFLPWRLGFAILVPPSGYCGGWLSFLICMFFIGLMSSIVCDFSELFGCCAGIEDYITAITFVALGTSMPDLFVSKTAAIQDEYADSSIVTVTGGDSSRVFLGIGIPWTIAAIYWSVVGPTEEWVGKYGNYLSANPQGAFIVPGGMLGFNVILYLMAALPCIVMLRIRRAVFGAELGGPFVPKVLTSIMFVLLWFFYLIISIWKIKSGSDNAVEIISVMWNSITALEHLGVVAAIILFWMMRKQTKRGAGRLDEESTGEMADWKPDEGLRNSALAASHMQSIPAYDHYSGQRQDQRQYMSQYSGDQDFEDCPVRSVSLTSNLLVGQAAVRFKRGLESQQQPSRKGHLDDWQQPTVVAGHPVGLRGQIVGHPVEHERRVPSLSPPRPLQREDSFHSVDHDDAPGPPPYREPYANGFEPPAHGFEQPLHAYQQQSMALNRQQHAQPAARGSSFPRQQFEDARLGPLNGARREPQQNPQNGHLPSRTYESRRFIGDHQPDRGNEPRAVVKSRLGARC